MSPKQTVISGKELLRVLQKLGFVITRVRGSHHILKHENGKKITVPVHKNDDLPRGLLSKIIREDLKITFEEFERLLK
jgi:predicted RNA binding protein YcfA (HicA-like mRNA interferase family)